MKKLFSLLTALAMLLSGIGALAAEPELTLVPLSYDETGVLPMSAFLLSGYAGEAPSVMVNGEITATAKKNADGSFTITPDEPLEYNRLYTFDITGEGRRTWIFQTAVPFAVVSSIPGNYAYRVPISSGLEFKFTHSDLDMASIEESFTIRPKVDGKWEQHKETAVFVPKAPLDYNEEYTVTLSGDAGQLCGTKLGEDYSFTFTTESEPVSDTQQQGLFWLYADNRYCEVPASVAPSIGFNLSYYKNTDQDFKATLKAEVFPLDEGASVSWLIGDMTTRELTEELSKPIMSFEYIDESGNRWLDIPLTLPEPLPNGFYLVRLSGEGDYAQTVVQSTDMAAYIFSDAKQRYGLWPNDLMSGAPVSGASLSLDGAEAVAVTDSDGLALLPADKKKEYIKAVAPSGETAYYPVRNYGPVENKYHVLMETERPLYQPEDTVYIWGAVKPYGGFEAPSELMVELHRGSYRSTPLLTQKVNAEEGVFGTEMELPCLSTGYYTLFLKDGDELLGSTYFSVEEYVKPDYKLTLTADKKAIFLGESINYTATAAFFEGTGLPELDLDIYDSGYSDFAGFSMNGKTDKNGVFSFAMTPEYTRPDQGSRTFNMAARATLPETGNITSTTYTTVLLNDISVRLSSEYENGVSTVTVHSDALTTDKVNSGESWSYIKGPDAGRRLYGRLKFVRYMKEQTGTGYNYILKRSYPIYHYYTVEEPVSEFTLVTDSEGDASYSFTPTDTEGGYYRVQFSCIDGMGRTYSASGTVRTSENYWHWYSSYSNTRFVADKESYNIGDTARLRVINCGEPVEGRFLFIRDYNGITDMQVSGGEYETEFDAAPNIFISCVEFEPGDGYTTVYGDKLSYDQENSRINIEAEFDKEKYIPGEKCEVRIKTTDKYGAPVSASISMGVVDEALFALRNQNVDMLYEYFAGFGRCVTAVYTSHRYASRSNVAYAPESAWGAAGGSAGYGDKSAPAALRVDFRDTAAFITAKTDENGEAALTFDLPDNTTTWRATFMAVNDTGAGDAQLPIVVTIPAFLSWNINETFIVGDVPMIGLSLYGSELRGDETVTFTADDGNTVTKAQGRPFERVNLQLSPMDAPGERTVTVSADIDGRTVDMVQDTVTVIDTYNRTIQETIYDSPFDAIQSDGVGNVRIAFTDKNRASLLGGIYRMMGWAGDRIDQKTANYRAAELLNTYFAAELSIPEINWLSYQGPDGGIRLLPYGSSDPEITVRLTPYIKDHVDKALLVSYLRKHKTRPGALYALASLREPVLDELSTAASAENLSPVQRLYAVLALCELGDCETARQAYSYIEPLYEDFGEMRRVLTGEDNDDILEATSLAAVAALYLGRSDAEKLYRYSTTNRTSDILTNIETMAYIDAAIQTLPEEKGSVTYELYGQSYTKEFHGRECCSLEVPAAKLSNFRVVSASDSVKMVSAAERKIDVAKLSNPHVSIERSYFKDGSAEPSTVFTENEIVVVRLTVKFSDQALEGGYVINDYLPSGLELLKGDGRYRSDYYCSGSGQRVRLSCRFYDNKADIYNNRTFTYYARVVNPGEFTADNATIQSSRSPEILAATGRERITVTALQ